MSKQPPPTSIASAVGSCPTLIQVKGRRPSVPPRFQMSVCGEYVYNIYVKKAIKEMANYTTPLPRPKAAWAFENSPVHFKTHIINILSFYKASYRQYLFNRYMIILHWDQNRLSDSQKRQNTRIQNSDHLHNVKHAIQSIFQNV